MNGGSIGVNIIESFQNGIFGRLVVLTITENHVRICQGKKSPEYELPKTFQCYKFLNHIEEMAGWLRVILREEKIQIRRCKIVLASGQAYWQIVQLPDMTLEEQRNWVRWEGSQFIPFEPGTYQAVLLLWPDLAAFGVAQKTRVSVTADLSAGWQATEAVNLQNFLLIAVPLEIIESLKQFADFVKAKLESITVIGPNQVVLPINLLPVASRKELILKRGYQTATVLCLLMSIALAVRGGISWQRAQRSWLETERQLVPYQSVKTAYENSKKTDYQIRQYQEKLQHISRTEPVCTPALRSIGSMIPDECWLEELQQKHTPASCLEIKGCAIELAQISEFLDNLEQSGIFSKVRLVESGTKRIILKNKGDNSKKVVSFVLLAELASERKEVRP